jgi:hypothetical protein
MRCVRSRLGEASHRQYRQANSCRGTLAATIRRRGRVHALLFNALLRTRRIALRRRH